MKVKQAQNTSIMKVSWANHYHGFFCFRQEQNVVAINSGKFDICTWNHTCLLWKITSYKP